MIFWLALAGVVGATLLQHLGGRVAERGAALTWVQAAGSGLLLWNGLPPRRRWLGALAGAVLLTGVALGGKLALTGLSHAMLYGALLVAFGRTLLPGRVALVTQFAQRLNPRFRPAMVPYTRGVTVAWCAFASFQLVASAALLACGDWLAWAALTGWAHAPMALALALGEFLLRRRRFPGEHTGFVATIKGIRAGS